MPAGAATITAIFNYTPSSYDNNSGNEGSSDSGSDTTKPSTEIEKAQEIINALTTEEKQETAKNIKAYLPYTLPTNKPLTVEQLQILTKGRFTKKQLETMIENPEILKNLGVDATSLITVVTLKPIKNAEFKDVESSNWASESIKAAAELGLVAGLPDGSFEPAASLKIADTFTFINRVTLLNDVIDSKLTRSMVVWHK